MTPIERITLESLQYLLWVHKPRSDMSEEKRDKLMVDNHLLLHPIGTNENCCDMDEGERCKECMVLHSPENCPNKKNAKRGKNDK